MPDLKTIDYSSKMTSHKSKLLIEKRTQKVLKLTFFKIIFVLSKISFWFIFYFEKISVALGKTSKMGAIFGILSSDFLVGQDSQW